MLTCAGFRDYTFLAYPSGSKICPMALLILCDPVWLLDKNGVIIAQSLIPENVAIQVFPFQSKSLRRQHAWLGFRLSRAWMACSCIHRNSQFLPKRRICHSGLVRFL